MIDRDDLRRLIAKADQHPRPWWVLRPVNPQEYAYIAYGNKNDPTDSYEVYENYDVDGDYELICAAVNALPELLDALEVAERRAKFQEEQRILQRKELNGNLKRLGYKQGELQLKWRTEKGLKKPTDNTIEYAILDALVNEGGAHAWCGDGSSCAAQIVENVLAERDTAEKKLEQIKQVGLVYCPKCGSCGETGCLYGESNLRAYREMGKELDAALEDKRNAELLLQEIVVDLLPHVATICESKQLIHHVAISEKDEVEHWTTTPPCGPNCPGCKANKLRAKLRELYPCVT